MCVCCPLLVNTDRSVLSVRVHTGGQTSHLSVCDIITNQLSPPPAAGLKIKHQNLSVGIFHNKSTFTREPCLISCLIISLSHNVSKCARSVTCSSRCRAESGVNCHLWACRDTVVLLPEFLSGGLTCPGVLHLSDDTI